MVHTDCYRTMLLIRAIEAAERWLPGRFSMDILFGRPEQTTGSWLNELAEVNFCMYRLSCSTSIKRIYLLLPSIDLYGDPTSAIKRESCIYWLPTGMH